MKESETHKLPLTTTGIENFLAGPWIDGIGPAYARRLTERFGTDTLKVLENSPELALEVHGIGPAKITAASESIKALSYPLDLVAFLYSCGLTDLFIERIFGKYRKATERIILEDPYSMVEDVWQLSFFTADKIGRKMGIAPNDPRRLRGALVSAVKQYAEEGHLFARPEEAVGRATEMTGATTSEVSAQIEPTVESGRLVKSRGDLYLPVFYKAEKEGARKLKEMAALKVEEVPSKEIPAVDHEGHRYSRAQKRAISLALNNPVTILTGGPGSGKTTVLKGIIEALEKRGKKVVLAAPTGRAAKRMTTLTGVEASTIHRLLGYRQGEGYNTRLIDADVLIIDEGSMMEQVLFNHLLEAVRPGTRIILVGDVDQLPAIGAGDVLRDMIDSGAVPVAHLNENFRQAAGSLIASGARAINKGEIPASDSARDFMIISENGTQRIHDRLISLVTKELPEARNIESKDIMVVTPQQIGPLGARQLNADLQQALNPKGAELKRGTTILREGDPVMQRTNSSERGVYNGEVGKIAEVDEANRSLLVRFADGRESTYANSELGELVLAYATTVHKLQGSEVRYMVFPVSMAHKPMLYRNLLYTGVSRASDLCVLVGEDDALRFAISNNPSRTRNSHFRHRLSTTA